MNFILNKEELLEVLQKVSGPTATKQNLPILSSVLISSFGGKLKFTTTDLDTTIISFKPANIKSEGTVAIPMKRFFSIIKELPPGEILVENIKNNLIIKCEKIEFKINTINPDDFPQIQEEKGASLIKIDPGELENMIKLTSFCVGYEDVNYVLGGILFEFTEDRMSAVATDGKRLAFSQKKLPLNQPAIKEKISFILPIRAVIELQKLIKERKEDIYMFGGDKKIGFDFKDTQFIARPVEGEFPNYSQYIPESGKNKLYIDRKKFLFSLRRAGILSTSDHQGVRLSLNKDSLGVYKNTPQLGEVKEDIDVRYNGSHTEIGFNPNYITDVLKNIEDQEICIDFFGADKPAVLRKEDYIYLILPMKT